MDVTIVDCGIGNIKSVERMFQAADATAEIVSDPASLKDCRRLALPGVGAFDAGMAALNDGWRAALDQVALERRIPVLGICLGMQLLCRGSEEGEAAGLGWIAGDVVTLDLGGNAALRLPHMGWSVVTPARNNPLIPSDAGEQRFYHVHKYRAVCDREEDVLATTEYGTRFVTAVQRDNIFGVQFHPEKSHRFGLQLMRNFLALPC
ncbi:imidazole glycerol phosphate synthase subunit HisH [Allosphingosinicella indica]|uniref:Imidazole glycerol phosphate synthase subunit HisH n=1 Tax=Allosphingosinicella indica TaxID=941907 RepID=A0A1X7G193_9SPHN|nr:imidazole glycerol phosphate synthase subunit HisH [Allosphingosinicella indica]SMF62186.1 glutamine amidotransferase [Allosphingosinicella indica]